MIGKNRVIVLIPAGLLVGLLLATPGCGGRPTPTGSPTATNPPAKAAEVALKKAKLEEVSDHIKSQKGKVVVADLWNDLCPPCKAEFPNLVKLHKKYGEKVACLSVSVGLAPDKFYDKSLAFLKKQEAGFPNFMLDEDAEWEKVFKVGTGAVPAIFVYDQKGNTVFEYRDGFFFHDGKKGKGAGEEKVYDEVFKTVEKLVNQPD